jgi:aspartate/methionine/tyrosine aminotransferase
MYSAPRYLSWAMRHYGKVEFDLASSGVLSVPDEELGDLAFPRAADAPGRLRQAIAAFNGARETEVVAALGATHALWLAYASVLRPGDEVLVESPGYEPVGSIAETLGARVMRFPREPRDGYAIDLDAVSRRLTPRTRIVALTSPHNPSGQRVGVDTLRALANLLASRDVYLLVDEVYAPSSGMAPDGRTWKGSARQLGGRVLAVSSLTKCFGLGHARIGWLLAPTNVISHAEAVLLTTCGSLPNRHATLGVWAFERVHALAARARELGRGKREIVSAWMARREDLVWSDPPDGLFGFAVCKTPGDLLARIEAGAERQRVLVAAGTFFGIDNGFRLSWTIGRDLLEEGLRRVGHVLDT